MTPPWGVPSLLFLPPLICAVVVSDRRFEPHPYQLQYPFIGNPLFEELHQFIMGMVSKYELKSASYTWSYPLFQMFTYCCYPAPQLTRVGNGTDPPPRQAN
jgi:hypothetical protein